MLLRSYRVWGDVVGQVLALTKVVVREDGKMHLIFYIFGGVF